MPYHDRTRTRRIVTFAAFLAIFAARVAQRVDASPSYTVTGLGTLGGAESGAGRINSHAQIVGHAQTSQGKSHSFLYQDGQMTDLGIAGVQDINDSGVMVGRIELADGYGHAFIFQNNQVTVLNTPGLYGSQATAINNSGLVVGDSGFPNYVQTQAFSYQNGQITHLGDIGGDLSQALNVNDNGQIVGYAKPPNSPGSHAFLYDGGVMRDLGTLGGSYSIAYGINNLGEVVGQADLTGDTALHAFIYANGQMQDLGTLGGLSVAWAINNHRQVVGYSLPNNSQPGRRRAFLYENGSMADLNTLIPASSGWTLEFAGGINDSGWIVGTGINPQGRREGFLLQPIPEPGMTGLGICASLAAIRRRLRGARIRHARTAPSH